MKKAKRFLMMALAAAMVLCVALTPASAVTDSDSYDGKFGDYTYRFRLSVTDTSATGSVSSSNHGIVIPDPYCSVGGSVTYYYYVGQEIYIKAEPFYSEGTTSCSASANDITGITISATASYNFCGATQRLSV